MAHTVLVTGADGFIGSHLTEELVKKGERVKAFCCYNSFNSCGWIDSLAPEIRSEIEVFLGDIRDPNGVRTAMQGVDEVFHLAALIAIPFSYHSPDSYVDTNIKGTLNVLQAAREIGERNIPIIGVNLGTLGYMTEIEPANLEEALGRLVAGEYEQECRMMLEGRVCFFDGGVQEDWALNDIVLSRSGSLQIIRFDIYVNGQFLNSYNADGMIVTTPTGSTGYNLSAGGPLVEPRARLMMLTPICPHSLHQRSIILSPEDVIDIQIPECRRGGVQTVEVNFDGSHVIPLRTGDRIRVTRSEKVTEFIRLNQISFLDVLHRKMQA